MTPTTHKTAWHPALSLLILLALLGMLWLLLLRPAFDSRQAFAARVADMQAQYRRFAVAAAQTEHLRATVAALRQNGSPRRGFLTENTAALAAADLQNHIKRLIEDTGGALISAQVMPQGEQEQVIFPRVGIRVRMRGGMDTVQRLLYRVAADGPVLLLDNILLQNPHGGGHAAQEAARLEIRFDVTGFIYRPRQS